METAHFVVGIGMAVMACIVSGKLFGAPARSVLGAGTVLVLGMTAMACL